MSEHFQALARAAAQRAGIPPAGYVAQIGAESAWNPSAVSPRGAQGLAQFMPATWAEWGRGLDPLDPEASLDAGARYMAWIPGWLESQEVPGTWALTLASYNWGIGNVRNTYREHGSGWLQHLPTETRRYVLRLAPAYGETIVAPASKAAPLLIVAGLALLWWIA